MEALIAFDYQAREDLNHPLCLDAERSFREWR